MWDRVELKRKGKAAFKKDYWKCVLVAFILSFFVGGSSPQIKFNFNTQSDHVSYQETLPFSDFDDTGNAFYSEFENTGTGVFTNEAVNTVTDHIEVTYFHVPLSISIGTLFSVFLILAIALRIFILNLIEIGGCKYFIENAQEKSTVSKLLFAFDSSYYKGIVITQLLRDVFIFLWSLLLIIPGIIKSYEYCMIPYILADNPQMDYHEAFRKSKDMMYGQKLDTLILDLSFFGWNLLNGLTFGLVGIFYVEPYICATKAELYLALKEKDYVVQE